MANPQKTAIDSYLKELADLVGKRFDLNNRISRLEQVVSGMIDLLDKEDEQVEYMDKLYDVMAPISLTSAIEQVLKSERRNFTPTEVRDQVKDHLRTHANPMASVHTILKRLVKTGWVESSVKDGKTYYRYLDLDEQVSKEFKEKFGFAPRRASKNTLRDRLLEIREIDPEKLPDDVRGMIGHPKKK